MMPARLPALLTVVLALAAAPALAQPASPPSHQDQGAARQMMAAMDHMSQAMQATPMTGDPDHDFVAMMLPHHQGAVEMARIELRHGHDPQLHRLAEDIVAAQDREIALMKRWQASHPRH